MHTERVTIEVEGGAVDAVVFRPDGEASRPPVLFYQDGLGLRPALERIAARFAAAGYVVLLPNMFWRAGAFPPIDAKTVFQEGNPERERVMKLVRTATSPALAMKDTEAFLRFLDARSDVRGPRVGCVGYCLGGLFAMTAAGTFPERVAAAASIHGARLATDEPDSPHLLAPKMRGEIYVGVAEIDRAHTPETTARLEEAFTSAGVRHTIELYPGVVHGFAPDDTAVHDAAASDRHFERVLALFARTLGAA